jgi:hypothetical protein
MKGSLAHALKIELTNEDREDLLVFMMTLSDEASAQEEENGR